MICRADWRVGGGEVRGSEIAAAVLRNEGRERGLRWEEEAVLLHDLRRGHAQRAVIVQHVDAAAEGADHQVVHLFLDSEVAHHDGGQADVELHPLLAADVAPVEAEFGAGEEQLRIHVIFGDGVHAAALGQVAGDVDPGLAVIGALDQIGFEVAVLVVLVGDVDGAGIVLRGQNALHIGVLGHAGRLLDFAPVLAAVFGDLHEAIVGADVDQAFLLGRFGDREMLS